MLSQIANARDKLKHAPEQQQQPRTQPKKQDEEVCFSEEEIRQIKTVRFEVNMDNWISNGETTPGGVVNGVETIMTLSAPLSRRLEAALYRSLKPSALDPRHPKPHERVFRMTDEEVRSGMDELVSIIDDLILRSASTPSTDSWCFVKLSCRSAKDVAADSDRLDAIYQQWLQSNSADQCNDNERLAALYRASLNVMKVRNAAEALDLLLSSGRIAFDLALDLHGIDADVKGEGDEASSSMSVIVREWIDIPLSSEFRVFVSCGEDDDKEGRQRQHKITAISQYYTQLFFSDMSRHLEYYVDQISAFFESIKDRPVLRSYKRYCIDLVVFPPASEQDEMHQRVLVLELNPFHPSTGAGLFDWVKDDALLFAGVKNEKQKKTFEVRIVKEPIPLHSIRLLPRWTRLLSQKS